MTTGFRIELRGGELSPLRNYAEYTYEVNHAGAVCVYSMNRGRLVEVISALLWLRIIEVTEGDENNATKKTP